MGKGAFADETALRDFYLARLERFLRLVEEAAADAPPEHCELARRAAISAYCDCYDAGAGADAQQLMDRFLESGPGPTNGSTRGLRRGRRP